MTNSNINWAEWQKFVIKEDYKDIRPARDNMQRQFDKTVKDSLPKVKKYVRY
jgi:hypothetical protein